jgi:hypothetical protein
MQQLKKNRNIKLTKLDDTSSAASPDSAGQ